MPKAKTKLLVVPLTLLVGGFFLTSTLQLPQAHSQQDYEELIITESSEQELEQQELQYSYISEWGSSGTDNGQFQLPWSLTLDSSGDVYVVDRNNARIQKFDPDGNFIDKWSMGSLSPVGIAADSLDNIYVTAIDNGANVVTKFSNEGTFISRWNIAGPTSQVDTQNAMLSILPTMYMLAAIIAYSSIQMTDSFFLVGVHLVLAKESLIRLLEWLLTPSVTSMS